MLSAIKEIEKNGKDANVFDGKDSGRAGGLANLTCYFRDIRTGKKFWLSAYNDDRDRCYTPRDGVIDFSEVGIENSLYLVETIKTRKGTSAWDSAKLLLPSECREEILARIGEVYSG